ncbi:MAG TPA: DinB family protein [Opitutaceae bacterium]|nr:DinB family protein [Opitutaceae bacterium]
MLFAVRRRLVSRAETEAQIAAERSRVDALVRECGPVRARQRVLIPRPRGLEDSSRYWSVYMTLDHLRIVNAGAARVIRELLADRVPPVAATTAAVKPSADVDERVVPAFQASCDDLLSAGKDAPTLATRLRYAHPWFGPLNAAAWKYLGGMHLALHRGQIERILKTMAESKSTHRVSV